MLGRKRAAGRGGAFGFRVSDVLTVPLRGTMLRLRVVEGAPSMEDLGVGSTLRLQTPAGGEHDVEIRGHAVTGGKPTQQRLERTRELDVLVDDRGLGEEIQIGWVARGPVN